MKNLTIQQKIEKLTQYMQAPDTDDQILALNVFHLIKKSNVHPTFFEHESIIYSSLVELADMRQALGKTIVPEFVGRVLGIYASCIRYCGIMHKTEETENLIPRAYYNFLCMSDFLFISVLGNNFKTIDVEEGTKYDDSLAVVLAMSNKLQYLGQFIAIEAKKVEADASSK